MDAVVLLAVILLPALVIAASSLTILWIKGNRRHLDNVWPTMVFSGAAAAPGLILFAKIAYKLGFQRTNAPGIDRALILICGISIACGPVLLFLARGPARPDSIPEGLNLVQASHAALWAVSSVLAYILIGYAA